MTSITIVTPWLEHPELVADYTDAVLPELQDHDEVIVVDNGDAPSLPFARMITADVNLGYAKGSNLGLGHAATDAVLFLNNDVRLGRRGWLVGGDPWWDEAQASFGFNPSVDQIVVALEDAYTQRDSSVLLEEARKVGLLYDADLVTVKHWEPTLEALAKPREVPPLKGSGVNRQMRRAAKRKVKA